MEEVLALRFAIDWLSAALNDATEFIDMATKRRYSRYAGAANRKDLSPMQQQMELLKEKSLDSFGHMWTEDAEMRGVANLAIRLFDGLEGQQAMHFAATVSTEILKAMWKGVHPMLASVAKLGISRIAETSSSMGMLPPPSLADVDEDVSNSPAFDRIAASYMPPPSDCLELVSALPRGVT